MSQFTCYRWNFEPIMRIFFTSALYITLFTRGSRANAPHIEPLTETEIKYAKLFRTYSVHDRVLAAPQGEQPPGDYNFMIPLPERLAGITYIGHAARLRLVLERARRGTALAPRPKPRTPVKAPWLCQEYQGNKRTCLAGWESVCSISRGVLFTEH